MCEIERFENEGGAIVDNEQLAGYGYDSSRTMQSNIGWNPNTTPDPAIKPWMERPYQPYTPYVPPTVSIPSFWITPQGETVSSTIVLDLEQYNVLVDALTTLRNIRDLADVLTSDDLYSVIVELVDSTEEVNARDSLQERLDRSD